MNKTILMAAAALLLLPSALLAQDEQQLSEKEIEHNGGTLRYRYYLSPEGEEVWHDNFVFTDGVSEILDGYYEHGKRTGVWSIAYQPPGREKDIYDLYVYFKDDSLTNRIRYSKKVGRHGGVFLCGVEKGILRDDCHYSFSNAEGGFYIKGDLNDRGEPDGKWTVVGDDKKHPFKVSTEEVWRHGVLVSRKTPPGRKSPELIGTLMPTDNPDLLPPDKFDAFFKVYNEATNTGVVDGVTYEIRPALDYKGDLGAFRPGETLPGRVVPFEALVNPEVFPKGYDMIPSWQPVRINLIVRQ